MTPLADVAQLVEQRIRNAKVGGSTPLIGTSSHPASDPTLPALPNRRNLLCWLYWLDSALFVGR